MNNKKIIFKKKKNSHKVLGAKSYVCRCYRGKNDRGELFEPPRHPPPRHPE